MVRALDLRSKGRGFDSRLMHCRATTLGKLFTPMCLFTKQYNLVPCEGFHAKALVMWLPCMGPMNKGREYCRSGSAVISRLLRTAI